MTSNFVYGTEKYAKWRMTCLGRDGFKCKLCSTKKHLQVHHIVHLRVLVKEKKDLYNISNGLTLCKECHKNIHFIENIKNQKYLKTECVYKSTMINNMEMMII